MQCLYQQRLKENNTGYAYIYICTRNTGIHIGNTRIYMSLYKLENSWIQNPPSTNWNSKIY